MDKDVGQSVTAQPTHWDERYRQSYDAEAGRYDQTRFGNRHGLYAKRLKNEWILDVLQRHNAEVVLDLATGTGRVAHDLVRQPFRQIHGADLSRTMLEHNREGVGENFESHLKLCQANMRSLAYRANTFDAVVLGSFLHLIPETDYVGYTDDIWRVLKPDGVLVAEVPNSFTVFNPVNMARIWHHKYWRHKRIKSYVAPWDLRRLFPLFKLDDLIGVEYPLVGKSFAFHRFQCRLLGRMPLTRWMGGRLMAVLSKDVE